MGDEEGEEASLQAELSDKSSSPFCRGSSRRAETGASGGGECGRAGCGAGVDQRLALLGLAAAGAGEAGVLWSSSATAQRPYRSQSVSTK